MKSQIDQKFLQDLLVEDFSRRKQRNPAFSIRGYAEKLKISHPALSEILSGKRLVGRKLADRLCDTLMLSPDIRAKIYSDEALQRNRQALQLKADHYKVISDWYHFGIMSLVELNDFKSDVSWIAQRLGITKSAAQDALDRLVRLEMLRKSNGKIVSTGQSFDSPDGTPNGAVRNAHHQFLELAKTSLDRDDIRERDFNGMTMAIDPRKLPEAKKRIRKFRDELCEFLESDNKTQVYQLSLQLFPLSKKEVLK